MDNSLDGSMGFADGVIPMVETIEDEEKNPEDSSPEKNKEEVNAPKSGDDKDKSSKKSDKTDKEPPFHQHPRWKQMKHDLAEKDSMINTLQGTVKEVLTKVQQIELNSKMNNPEQWFVEKYGYDIPLWQQYLKDAKVPEQFQPKEEQITYDEKFWNKQFDSEIDKLSEAHNIDFDSDRGQKIKEELFTFLYDNDITHYDEKVKKEVYDFEKGWKLFVKFKNNEKKTSSRNKEIASMSKSGSKAEPSKNKGIPIEELRKMNYKDFYENFADGQE